MIKGIILTSLLMLGQQSSVFFGSHGTPSAPTSGAACIAPTVGNRWVPSGGTNGTAFPTLVDVVAGNNGTASGSNEATYTTAGPNGQPALTFSGTNQYAITNITLGTTSDTYLWFFVFKPSDLTGLYPLVGGSVSGNIEAVVNAGKMVVNSSQSAVMGTGIHTYSTTSYNLAIVEWVSAAGTWKIMYCAGGTCTTDASGTTSASAYGDNGLGFSVGDGSFSGSIAEWGFTQVAPASLAATEASIGTWGNCRYAI